MGLLVLAVLCAALAVQFLDDLNQARLRHLLAQARRQED